MTSNSSEEIQANVSHPVIGIESCTTNPLERDVIPTLDDNDDVDAAASEAPPELNDERDLRLSKSEYARDDVLNEKETAHPSIENAQETVLGQAHPASISAPERTVSPPGDWLPSASWNREMWQAAIAGLPIPLLTLEELNVRARAERRSRHGIESGGGQAYEVKGGGEGAGKESLPVIGNESCTSNPLETDVIPASSTTKLLKAELENGGIKAELMRERRVKEQYERASSCAKLLKTELENWDALSASFT